MLRFNLVLAVAVGTFAGLSGCTQHCFTGPGDLTHYKDQALNTTRDYVEPADLTPVMDITAVTTVLSPEAKKRYLSLSECIALALENGRTGSFLDRPQGLPGQAPASSFTDSMRVFAYDPAIQAADIEQSLAKFDARWRTSMTWNKTDQPTGTAEDIFRTFGQDRLDEDRAQFQTELQKPLPTGGLAGITFNTDYQFSNLASRVNPAYRPVLEFNFEQPLLRGAGVAINQLRGSHPGAVRTPIPFGPGGRVPGILLTRIFYDQSQVEFEQRVHELLLEVEQRYWDLYRAYWNYYAREAGMRGALLAWQLEKVKYEIGKVPEQNVAFLQAQFQQLRGLRLQALGGGSFVSFTGSIQVGILEAERRLRYVIGLPAEDGTRLIPSDSPTTAPIVPDWNLALAESMARRPELIQSRQAVQVGQLVVLREQDDLLPELRFFANYNINALGTHLDGKDANGALRNLAENEFNDWGMGLRLEVPLGFREAHSAVQQARLQLAQRVAFLRDQEQRVAMALLASYRTLIQNYEEIRIQRARRLAAATQLERTFDQFKAGAKDVTAEDVLNAQANWAGALLDEYSAVTNYNIALADFEFQKGTIMDYDNVAIVEGPLPVYAQARASEHIRERERSCVLRQAGCDSCGSGAAHSCSYELGGLILPELAAEEPAPLPAIVQRSNSLPALPDQLAVDHKAGTAGVMTPLERPSNTATLPVLPAASVPLQK